MRWVVLLREIFILTFFVAVNFSDEDSSGVRKLGRDLVGRLVPDGCQHVAEPTPVCVEVDENEFIFG
jgi:hypothetical protein